MKILNTRIVSRFKIIFLLTVSMTLSIVLLMIRMKLNQSFFFLFLVWNLFLAVLPYAITTYLRTKDKLSKWSLLVYFCAWLLFLPNAPYIITDLLHLRMSNQYLMWLDVLVVTSFAYNGLILFFLSLLDMECILKSFITSKKRFYLMTFIPFLTGFGIYLGRFLRYNSWEILQNPLALFGDIMDIVLHPTLHLQAWVFTLTFGAFLSVGYWVFKSLKNEL
jgi:uncharacterized membrane protein